MLIFYCQTTEARHADRVGGKLFLLTNKITHFEGTCLQNVDTASVLSTNDP
jgi:hypothetical protein